jgi:hypothetical protein
MYGSVRQIQLLTSSGKAFNAGPDGFDNEAALIVDGASLVGFHAWINPDNFINGLALMVRHDTPPKPTPRSKPSLESTTETGRSTRRLTESRRVPISWR